MKHFGLHDAGSHSNHLLKSRNSAIVVEKHIETEKSLEEVHPQEMESLEEYKLVCSFWCMIDKKTKS